MPMVVVRYIHDRWCAGCRSSDLEVRNEKRGTKAMMSTRPLAKASRAFDSPFGLGLFIYLAAGACTYVIYLLSRLGRHGDLGVLSWGSFVDDPVGSQLLTAWLLGVCFVPEPRFVSQIRPYPSVERLVTGSFLFVVGLMMAIVGGYAWDARACEYGGKICLVADCLIGAACIVVSCRRPGNKVPPSHLTPDR